MYPSSPLTPPSICLPLSLYLYPSLSPRHLSLPSPSPLPLFPPSLVSLPFLFGRDRRYHSRTVWGYTFSETYDIAVGLTRRSVVWVLVTWTTIYDTRTRLPRRRPMCHYSPGGSLSWKDQSPGPVTTKRFRGVYWLHISLISSDEVLLFQTSLSNGNYMTSLLLLKDFVL